MAGRKWYGIVFAILAFWSSDAAAESRRCTRDEAAAANRVLWLNAADRQLSILNHLPWGVPNPTQPVTREELLVQRDYIIGHDADLLVPIWTAHRLDSQTLGRVGRIDCFRRDPRIRTPGASLPSDYNEPIFDQGHMTPNSDMSSSIDAVINSFILSNMTPQYCQFNRGVWQILESIVRLWAHDAGTLYVMTGSIFDRDRDSQRDPDDQAVRMKSKNGRARVAVPSHFYKIAIRPGTGNRLESITILLPHDQTDLDGDRAIAYLDRNVRSIRDVEQEAGVKLLPELDRPLDEARQLWTFTGTPSRSLVDDRCRRTLVAGQPGEF